METRNAVISLLRKNFEGFGYLPLETAILNSRELLTYKYDESAEIVREIYKLSDQGERDLGLRFDLTVPLCKFIANNTNIRLPFKRYEFGKVFRNGPVKSGRLREFWQCDVDVVGDDSAEIEAEIVNLAVKCYLSLGIKPIIRIGNKEFLTRIVSKYTEEVERTISILDKIEKQDISNLVPAGLLDELAKSKCVEVEELFTLLDRLEISKYCKFDPYLARGLNVYTGTIWEVYTEGYGSSLGGGGRYDNIITNFIEDGRRYPAVGISFGLEPITAILSGRGVKSRIDLLVIPLKTFKESNRFAERERALGSRVMVWTGSVRKGLEYANATKIRAVSVIGDEEVRLGKVKVRDMESGEEVVQDL
jgi:histidyl-tRNA synthetase